MKWRSTGTCGSSAVQYLVLVENPYELLAFTAADSADVERIRAHYDAGADSLVTPYTLRVLSRPENGTVYRDLGIKDSRAPTPEG
jgi:hypothetical protein